VALEIDCRKGYSRFYPRPYLNFSQHMAGGGNRH
jgi:hypothetical protein